MTTFKGHVTGFKPGKSNDCIPNADGPPKTKFGGRPAVPAGPLKRYPGSVADTDDAGSRRMAKTRYGEGEGSGVNFRSHTAFGNQSAKSKPSKSYDTKGGNGMRKGRKT